MGTSYGGFVRTAAGGFGFSGQISLLPFAGGRPGWESDGKLSGQASARITVPGGMVDLAYVGPCIDGEPYQVWNAWYTDIYISDDAYAWNYVRDLRIAHAAEDFFTVVYLYRLQLYVGFGSNPTRRRRRWMHTSPASITSTTTTAARPRTPATGPFPRSRWTSTGRYRCQARWSSGAATPPCPMTVVTCIRVTLGPRTSGT